MTALTDAMHPETTTEYAEAYAAEQVVIAAAVAGSVDGGLDLAFTARRKAYLTPIQQVIGAPADHARADAWADARAEWRNAAYARGWAARRTR